jgi:uncharacterized protein YoxC
VNPVAIFVPIIVVAVLLVILLAIFVVIRMKRVSIIFHNTTKKITNLNSDIISLYYLEKEAK